MAAKIELKLLDDAFYFEAKDEAGHLVHLDAAPDIGGHNNGVRPMQLLLMGLGGCSAIDALLILRKQKQQINDFRISIEGEREKDKQNEATVWEHIYIRFLVKGKVDIAKAERAVKLSMEKYCSATKTLELAGATIKWKVIVEDE